jgi:predicted lipoprotein with Yx(FWY)xxD motif
MTQPDHQCNRRIAAATLWSLLLRTGSDELPVTAILVGFAAGINIWSVRPAVVALGILLIACGAPAPQASATPTSSASAVPTSPPVISASPSIKAQLATASSRYGRIIVDASGRTLYLFDIERDGVPRCYDACAVNWPPLLATTAATSDPRLNQALITVSARRDGSRQLTYNGHSLYYYVGDRSAGEIKCQAVIEFGGFWYVIDTRGNKITKR